MYPRRTRASSRTPVPPATAVSYMPRENVKKLLLRKYRTKFRCTRNPQFDLALRSEIDSLMGSKDISQRRLAAVERKLQSLSVSVNIGSCIKPDVPTMENQNTVSMTLAAPVQTRQEQIQQSQSATDGGVLPAIRYGESLDQDYWGKIVENDLRKFAEEQRRAKFQQSEKQHRVRDELLRQIERRKEAKSLERLEDRSYDQRMLKLAEGMDEAEKKRALERLEKVRKEKQLRDRQLKGNTDSSCEYRIEEFERKRKTRSDELTAEQKNLETIRKKMVEEDLEGRKRREKRLQGAAQLRQENDNSRKIQDKRRLEEQEEEKRMVRIMAEAQERQQRLQLEETKAKDARIHALAKYAEEHVTKKDEVKRRMEEQRFIRAVLDKEKQDELDEKRRKQEHRQRELNARKYLDRQLEEKAARDQSEKRESRKLVETWRNEEESYRREQQEKMSATKRRNQAWRQEIVRQIGQSRDLKRRRDIMDEREFLINRKLIEESLTVTKEIQPGPEVVSS